MHDSPPHPVYMVVIGEITDPDRMQAYTEALAESLLYRQHEGYYAALGKPVEMLEEEWPSHQGLVLARFPSREHARRFWDSDKYQKEIKPLRAGAGRFTVGLFEELPVPGHIRWTGAGH
jgi:uncharacterized protein (DUF1330 family)